MGARRGRSRYSGPGSGPRCPAAGRRRVGSAPGRPGRMSGSGGASPLLALSLLLLAASGFAQPAGEAACRPVRTAFQVLQPGAKWVPENPVPGEAAWCFRDRRAVGG